MSRNPISNYFGLPFQVSCGRIIAKRMRPITWRGAHQGKQEMARRVRRGW